MGCRACVYVKAHCNGGKHAENGSPDAGSTPAGSTRTPLLIRPDVALMRSAQTQAPGDVRIDRPPAVAAPEKTYVVPGSDLVEARVMDKTTFNAVAALSLRGPDAEAQVLAWCGDRIAEYLTAMQYQT